MSRDPILALLGLSRRAGRLELGEEPVAAICRSRRAKLVLVASDASPNTCRRVAHFCQNGSILWLALPFSKEDLGAALGCNTCAVLSLTDPGLASSVLEQLAQRDPVRYGPAALRLESMAQKALQRQKEKRQHQKNRREGKKPPKPSHSTSSGGGTRGRQGKPVLSSLPKGPQEGRSRPDHPARSTIPSGSPGLKLSGRVIGHTIPKKRGGS